jgi:hypothetical protein
MKNSTAEKIRRKIVALLQIPDVGFVPRTPESGRDEGQLSLGATAGKGRDKM